MNIIINHHVLRNFEEAHRRRDVYHDVTTMNKIAMIVKTKAQPGKREEVLRLWQKRLQTAAETNPYQELIVYAFDAADPDMFYMFELYSSQEAIDQNAQNPAFWAYMQEAMPLLNGRPEVSTATAMWAKGINV